jgi:aminoglycoside phosphotransferase (APT) family kinase protein
MTDEPDTPAVSSRLLARLRRMDGMHSVGFAEPPSPIPGGFETRIFAFRLAGAPAPFDRPLILRLFREADAAPRARFEAAVHGAIAQQGYPVPRVLDWSADASPLGGAFLILERVPGENLVSRILDPALLRYPALLAGAQRRLHALDPAPVRDALAAAGFPPARLHPDTEVEYLERAVHALDLAGFEPGIAWLRAQRPGAAAPAVVCHGDFHPFNVLVHEGRVSGVIDWTLRHMKLAEPAYDVGATLVLLGHAPVDVPWMLRGVAGRLRRRLVRAYLESYRRELDLPEPALRYYEALRLLGCLLEAGEHALADRGLRARPRKPTAFGSPRVQAGMLERFRALTGVNVALPDGA